VIPRYLTLLLLLGSIVVLFYWSFSPISEVAVHLDQARAYLDKGDLTTAASQLQNALQKDPGNAQARLMLGITYLRMGNPGAAEKELQQARQNLPSGDWRLPLARAYIAQQKYEPLLQEISPEPGDPPATRSNLLALTGIAQIGLGQLEAARKTLATAQATDPDNPDVLMGFTYLALQEGNLAEAKRQLDKVVVSNPDRVEAWVFKGELHRLQKQYPESLAAYQRALDLQPGNILARLGLAAVFLDQGEWDRAITELDAVRAVLPDLPQANYLRAQALFQKKELAGALEALQQVLQVAPRYLPAFLLLGQVQYAQGQLPQAEDWLTRFVAAQPQHLGARKLLADIELQLKQPAEAIKVLEPALAQAPDDPQVLALLGGACLQTGDYRKGSEYLQKAVELAPQIASLRTQLALSHLALDQPDKAAEDLDAALGLGQQEALVWLETAWKSHPDNVTIGLLLTRQYLRYQENARALDLARRLDAEHPGDPKILGALGLARLANGDAQGAVADLRRLSGLQPGSASVWYSLAMAYFQADDRKAAAEALDRALALQQDFLPALAARVQLSLLEKRYDEALSDARTIQSQHANLGIGYQLEGDIRRRQGDLAKAITAYQAAYERSPSADLVVRLADTQRAGGAPQAAIESLRRWLTVQPQDVTVRLQLADYLAQQQQSAEAAAEYERIIGQAPDNVAALNNLAWFYQQTGDARAMELAERAFRLAPKHPEVADTLGWILVQGNQIQRGMELLRQAAAKAPQVPVIRYHLAVAYAKAGQREEARQELETLVNSGQGFEELPKARALLDSLQK
jgi:tetratricopeptide (TPR) repeat protein